VRTLEDDCMHVLRTEDRGSTSEAEKHNRYSIVYRHLEVDEMWNNM